jgi:hypothetical protein
MSEEIAKFVEAREVATAQTGVCHQSGSSGMRRSNSQPS